MESFIYLLGIAHMLRRPDGNQKERGIYIRYIPSGVPAALEGAYVDALDQAGFVTPPTYVRWTTDDNQTLTVERLELRGTIRFVTRPMTGDGNCQFRALAYWILGDAADHAALRANLMKFMSTHPEHGWAPMLLNEYADDPQHNYHAMPEDQAFQCIIKRLACIQESLCREACLQR